MHDRDALPQPQFVAPTLAASSENDSTAAPTKGKGAKPPMKGPAAKGKVPVAPVSKGKPVALVEAADQPGTEVPTPTEYVKPLLLRLLPSGFRRLPQAVLARMKHDVHVAPENNMLAAFLIASRANLDCCPGHQKQGHHLHVVVASGCILLRPHCT